MCNLYQCSAARLASNVQHILAKKFRKQLLGKTPRARSRCCWSFPFSAHATQFFPLTARSFPRGYCAWSAAVSCWAPFDGRSTAWDLNHLLAPKCSCISACISHARLDCGWGSFTDDNAARTFTPRQRAAKSDARRERCGADSCGFNNACRRCNQARNHCAKVAAHINAGYAAA